MGLVDDKRKVFTTIGSYTSFNEQTNSPKWGDLYPSINNKEDIVSYLLDVLKTIAGTEALNELIGGMFTKLIDSSEQKIKTALKKQFIQFNADKPLPTDFVTNGIYVKAKDIDIKGKLKIAPTSDSGQLIYNGTIDTFDKKAHDAIVKAGTDVPFLNMSIKYLDNTDKFNIKPTSSTKIGDFFTDYIDKTEIINKNELLTSITDAIYGVFSKKNNKTPEQVLDDLKIQKILDQVLNNIDDPFTILPKDNNELLKQANDLANGIVYYDLCCGLMPVSLSFNSLTNLITVVSGSTDPFVISNAIASTINESTTGNTITTEKNKQTVTDGFFQKLIKLFLNQMLHFTIQSPQIRILLGILSSINNNGQVLIQEAVNDMKDFAIMIKCMAKEILKMIAEFIFNLAVSYLIKLITPVIKKIIKEKINQYINIIKSLTPISNYLNST